MTAYGRWRVWRTHDDGKTWVCIAEALTKSEAAAITNRANERNAQTTDLPDTRWLMLPGGETP